MNFPPADSLLNGHSLHHEISGREIIRITIDLAPCHAGGKRPCTIFYGLDGKPTGGRSEHLTDDLIAAYAEAFPLVLEYNEPEPIKTTREWLDEARASGWADKPESN